MGFFAIQALKRATWCNQSSTIKYKQGTSNKVINVANNTPQASDTAMGSNGAVAGVLVVINGTRPTKVVTDVNIMGRNLTIQALTMASNIWCPSRR